MTLDALIPGGYRRYVALGDSLTEGVGDPDLTRPNGVRGWADRVAEVLADTNYEFRYANLAVRGTRLDELVSGQLPRALSLEPDLVSIYAGSVDIVRPRVDLDAVLHTYDETIRRLTSSGAKTLVFTAYGARSTALAKLLRGRFAVYNEAVRDMAHRHGATIVDYWRMTEYDDPGYWSPDRSRLATPGHELMAIKVLDILGVRHGLPTPKPFERAGSEADLKRLDKVIRLKNMALPWLVRRLAHRSETEVLPARYPVLTRPPETPRSAWFTQPGRRGVASSSHLRT